MTEAEWLTCEEPARMLPLVQQRASNRRLQRSSRRKLRLFSVACCRLFWDEFPIDATRSAIDVNERFADGRATEAELRGARNAAHSEAWHAEYYTRREPHGTDSAEQRAYYRERLGGATDDVLKRMYLVAFMTGSDQRLLSDDMPLLRTDPTLIRLGPALFRDIFGNPFRATAFPSDWRTPTVSTLTARMYESRDFFAMPILADALQDAGCDSIDILDHCRGAGPHVYGCWVIDRVLGKR
ncbi:Uncharacterized protein OS=Sorangium cellulosum (strain So ce56) GN=sce5710 PE=4 SV=1 [Gemmata massiliana]|uniref:Uncharacterized protein n=1 Tax=Gemmata massiliana TaxID=1210884 RepID=A0A6P2CZK5_9BACT|nr:hypothetical protein [Gemmata massiliana]VTR93796.1 Uncharacterized protein OS=Sorangium cellulosum (strain So ce56) GN=sce5710 PE=4 SV=1 [Gemmata massiliana]